MEMMSCFTDGGWADHTPGYYNDLHVFCSVRHVQCPELQITGKGYRVEIPGKKWGGGLQVRVMW